jgi:hypothetical protein
MRLLKIVKKHTNMKITLALYENRFIFALQLITKKLLNIKLN